MFGTIQHRNVFQDTTFWLEVCEEINTDTFLHTEIIHKLITLHECKIVRWPRSKLHIHQCHKNAQER